MKIKKLVLQNINSLYGKWEIDFDCKDFNADQYKLYVFTALFAPADNTRKK